jgi:hypothetical protein
MLPRVSRKTEIVSDAYPSTSKEMEVEPSIPNVAANQIRSSCDVGLFLTRDALIDDSVKYQNSYLLQLLASCTTGEIISKTE